MLRKLYSISKDTLIKLSLVVATSLFNMLNSFRDNFKRLFLTLLDISKTYYSILVKINFKNFLMQLAFSFVYIIF